MRASVQIGGTSECHAIYLPILRYQQRNRRPVLTFTASQTIYDRSQEDCRFKFGKARHTPLTYHSTLNGLLGFWGMGFCGLALLPSNSLRPGPRSLYTTVRIAEYFEIIA